jgi:hypothetical protein
MGLVKQHTHPIGEVAGEEKNTYECVLKQQTSRSGNYDWRVLQGNRKGVICLLAGREVPFSTQAKAHFVDFCRLIRSYAVRNDR